MADETGMSSGISVDSAFLGAEEEVSVDRLTEDLDPVTKYALTMMEDACADSEVVRGGRYPQAQLQGLGGLVAERGFRGD
jgi:hypothetical protein